MPSSVAIIASVEPQHTVTCVSGIDRSGRGAASASRAIAARSSGAPQVTAYWLTSASMARPAAALIASGAGKSGNPCDRLTAPCAMREPGHLADDRFGEAGGLAGGPELGHVARRVGPGTVIAAMP